MSPFFSSDRSVRLGQQSYTLPSSLNDSGDENENEKKESKTLLPTPRPYSDIGVEGISATLPIARTMVRVPVGMQLGDGVPEPLFIDWRRAEEAPPPPPPPPKSRLRYSQQVMSPVRLESGRYSTPEAAFNTRRFLAKDISKLIGVDVDVSPCSDTTSPIHIPEDQTSESSSVYSQDDPPGNPQQNRFSWQQLESEHEEVPALEDDDIDGISSQYSSWTTRSPTMSRARMSMPPPVITDDTLVPHPLQRKDRTHRKSRDSSTLDSYHQFVTELATTPTGTASPEHGGMFTPPNHSSGAGPGSGNERRRVGVLGDPYRGISGLPSDFATMCVDPRAAPQPPIEERQGSYFDFDSSSDEDGPTASSSSPPRRSRDRDSFLGSFLRLGHSDAHHHHQRHSTPSPNTMHYSSSRHVSSESERSGTVEGGKKRHSQLRSLREVWGSKRAAGEEKKEAKRREQLKAKISVQGGHRL